MEVGFVFHIFITHNQTVHTVSYTHLTLPTIA